MQKAAELIDTPDFLSHEYTVEEVHNYSNMPHSLICLKIVL